jgi:hypothetical protein
VLLEYTFDWTNVCYLAELVLKDCIRYYEEFRDASVVIGDRETVEVERRKWKGES